MVAMVSDNDQTIEITVVGLAYWADHAVELAQLLRASTHGTRRVIADPSGRGGEFMTVAQPLYWFAQPRELSDAMRRATDDVADARTRRDRDAGLASGADPTGDRLTMTVEEAATALGISRALAYESVQRGDIPCVRIGRRILVPRSRLMKLLDAASEESESDV
jgi:excisionase family DNA binding protein